MSYGHWGNLSSGDIDGTFNNLHFAQICGRGSLCKESHIVFTFMVTITMFVGVKDIFLVL